MISAQEWKSGKKVKQDPIVLQTVEGFEELSEQAMRHASERLEKDGFLETVAFLVHYTNPETLAEMDKPAVSIFSATNQGLNVQVTDQKTLFFDIIREAAHKLNAIGYLVLLGAKAGNTDDDKLTLEIDTSGDIDAVGALLEHIGYPGGMVKMWYSKAVKKDGKFITDGLKKNDLVFASGRMVGILPHRNNAVA